MKKWIFVLFIAICLIFTTLLGSSGMVSAQSKFKVPRRGDEISGFSVKEFAYDQSTKSNNVFLEHNKTGARILFIKNSDINRAFLLSLHSTG